jgi:purine-binding chemotaxis protein CheW
MYLFTLVKDYFINEKNEETMIKVEKEENMSEVAVFKISNEEYAFDIEDVKEIIRYEQITPIPEAPEFVEGLFNLRGSVIPVVSLQERLGFEKNIDDKTKIIVCNVQDDRVGFIVDDVSDILFIDDQNISQAKNKEAIFDEVINLDDGKRVILKISADKVLSEETLKNIKMASE